MSESSRYYGFQKEGSAVAFVSGYLEDDEFSSEEMAEAMTEISQTNDPLLKQKMFAIVLDSLTAENAESAYMALNANGGNEKNHYRNKDELRLLVNAWGRVAGAAAIASLQKMAEAGGFSIQDGEERRGRGGNEMLNALAGWATMDGDAATAYVNGLEPGKNQQIAAFGALQGMLINGVDEAMSFVESLPVAEDGTRRKSWYMGMVVGEMMEQGLDRTQSWVDTVTDPELRAGALTRVTTALMYDDHEEAADWIAQYANEEAAEWAVRRLVDSWSRDDPQAVTAWAQGLQGDAKVVALQKAMNSRERKDTTTAGTYVGELLSSPERDAAVRGVATLVSQKDPVIAMEWVETMGDSAVREEIMVEVVRDWIREDRVSAESWLSTSGLSEAALQAINESQERGYVGE